MNQVVAHQEINKHSQKVAKLLKKVNEIQEELNQSIGDVEKLNNKDIEIDFFSRLRGKTNAAISEQVKELGENLLVTQKVVLFLIELNHEKNEVLRSFHEALVNKILELETDQSTISDDLTTSQKNESTIVYQIKAQIEGRLALEASIDANSSSIGENKTEIEGNRSSIKSNKQQLDQHRSVISQNASRVEQNSTVIADHKDHLSVINEELQRKSELDGEQSEALAAHQRSIDELTNQFNQYNEASDVNVQALRRLVYLFGATSILALLLAAAGFVFK